MNSEHKEPIAWATAGLVLVTLIWGSTFVVVKESLESMPWTLVLALRFSFGALCLLPAGMDAQTLKQGVKLGLLLFVGFGTQTIGLQTTGAARAAFITGLSVIMVPWAASRFLRVQVSRRVWTASILALAGLGMLCFDPVQAEFVAGSKTTELCLAGSMCVTMSPPNIGDAWVFACSLAWSIYFLALEEPARRLAATARGAARFTSAQVLTVACIGWLLSMTSLPVLGELGAKAWWSMIYLGVAATALTTLLQVLGQRFVSPSRAAIIYALEPLFAALFAFVLLGERMGMVGYIGGAVMIGAMFLAQREL